MDNGPAIYRLSMIPEAINKCFTLGGVDGVITDDLEKVQ